LSILNLKTKEKEREQALKKTEHEIKSMIMPNINAKLLGNGKKFLMGDVETPVDYLLYSELMSIIDLLPNKKDETDIIDEPQFHNIKMFVMEITKNENVKKVHNRYLERKEKLKDKSYRQSII
jgi:hypothetical protein